MVSFCIQRKRQVSQNSQFSESVHRNSFFGDFVTFPWNFYGVVFVILAKIFSDAHFINRVEVTILILSLLLHQSRHQNTNQSRDF